MSNRDDQGGGRPPADDRTLLDPLSNDELEALRKARQRLQAQREGSAPPEARRQVVIGPDEDESIGHAPTRAMPALPSFDGKLTLDDVGPEPRSRVSGPAVDPAAPREGPGAAPAEPMSIYSGTVGGDLDAAEDAPTIAPHNAPIPGVDPRGPAPRATPVGASGARATPPAARKRAPSGPGAPPQPSGQTGFGENTLMWMAPPKPQPQAGATAGTTDVLPPVSKKASVMARARTFGVVLVLVLLFGGMAASLLLGGANGVVELYTDPADARVSIDGTVQTARTPVKLTMNEGQHTLELALEGYETKVLEVTVDAEAPRREDVVLVPKSQAGLLTVSVNVQPVSAEITIDGQKHEGKRTVAAPNLDPNVAHRIKVVAPGYKPVDREIPAGALKSAYTFVLQSDPKARPE